MQQQTQSTLDVIYENWRGYQEKLRNCITPLTNQQLSLQPAAHMWRWARSCSTSYPSGQGGSAAPFRMPTKA